MANDIYLQSDPLPLCKVRRQTPESCFAVKILAGGLIRDHGIEQAFRAAFESIKPIGGVPVGVLPHVQHKARENAELVHRTLTCA